MGTYPVSALSDVITRRHREFLSGVDKFARAATAIAGETVVKTTRVDTGLARSNWRASVGAPTTANIPPYAPGSKLGLGELANAQAAITQHSQTLAGWKPSSGIRFYISNNVPYIGILNDGGPHVAPGNMVQMARQAWSVFIKSNVKVFK